MQTGGRRGVEAAGRWVLWAEALGAAAGLLPLMLED